MTVPSRDAENCFLIKKTSCKSKTITVTNDQYRLGETLLQKETLALPDIVEVLGQRPYPLKASILEYLEELKERRVDEKAQEDAAAKIAEEEVKKEGEESTGEASKTDAEVVAEKLK